MKQLQACKSCNRKFSADHEGSLGYLASALRGISAIMQPDVALCRADVTDIANLFELLAEYGEAAMEQNDSGHVPEHHDN